MFPIRLLVLLNTHFVHCYNRGGTGTDTDTDYVSGGHNDTSSTEINNDVGIGFISNVIGSIQVLLQSVTWWYYSVPASNTGTSVDMSCSSPIRPSVIVSSITIASIFTLWQGLSHPILMVLATFRVHPLPLSSNRKGSPVACTTFITLSLIC